MKLFLTNDDGIDAPGLAALRRAVGDRSSVIVAPRNPQSQVSHRITTHEPIHLEQVGPDTYAVDAAPADCVRVALTHLELAPDWVISGINAGGNLGHDIYISGTVAAVREAAFLGVPGIAISQYKRRELDWDWKRTETLARGVLGNLLDTKLERGEYYNVNLPHLDPDTPDPEVIECDTCTEPLPVRYRDEEGLLHYTGVYSERSRTPGADVEHCLGGRITVSRLRI